MIRYDLVSKCFDVFYPSIFVYTSLYVYAIGIAYRLAYYFSICLFSLSVHVDLQNIHLNISLDAYPVNISVVLKSVKVWSVYHFRFLCQDKFPATRFLPHR